jgi:nitrogen fixation protein NifQ
MQILTATRDPKERYYRSLLGHGRGTFNDHALASMLASWRAGETTYPDFMGLGPEGYKAMMAFHFPGLAWPGERPGGKPWNDDAMPEYAELSQLFVDHQNPDISDQPWWIDLLVIGCSGHEHLWRDMGLFDRDDLSRLLRENFPLLAARNSRDMKWKKFLYKQLCEREGIIACPAPTCDACAHFSECFAPEE